MDWLFLNLGNMIWFGVFHLIDFDHLQWNMGVPLNGLFIMENPNLKFGWLGGTPISGNLHMLEKKDGEVWNGLTFLEPWKWFDLEFFIWLIERSSPMKYGGTPKWSFSFMENPNLKLGWLGGTPISGNLHMLEKKDGEVWNGLTFLEPWKWFDLEFFIWLISIISNEIWGYP